MSILKLRIPPHVSSRDGQAADRGTIVIHGVEIPVVADGYKSIMLSWPERSGVPVDLNWRRPTVSFFKALLRMALALKTEDDARVLSTELAALNAGWQRAEGSIIDRDRPVRSHLERYMPFTFSPGSRAEGLVVRSVNQESSGPADGIHYRMGSWVSRIAHPGNQQPDPQEAQRSGSSRHGQEKRPPRENSLATLCYEVQGGGGECLDVKPPIAGAAGRSGVPCAPLVTNKCGTPALVTNKCGAPAQATVTVGRFLSEDGRSVGTLEADTQSHFSHKACEIDVVKLRPEDIEIHPDFDQARAWLEACRAEAQGGVLKILPAAREGVVSPYTYLMIFPDRSPEREEASRLATALETELGFRGQLMSDTTLNDVSAHFLERALAVADVLIVCGVEDRPDDPEQKLYDLLWANALELRIRGRRSAIFPIHLTSDRLPFMYSAFVSASWKRDPEGTLREVGRALDHLKASGVMPKAAEGGWDTIRG